MFKAGGEKLITKLQCAIGSSLIFHDEIKGLEILLTCIHINVSLHKCNKCRMDPYRFSVISQWNIKLNDTTISKCKKKSSLNVSRIFSLSLVHQRHHKKFMLTPDLSKFRKISSPSKSVHPFIHNKFPNSQTPKSKNSSFNLPIYFSHPLTNPSISHLEIKIHHNIPTMKKVFQANPDPSLR